MGHGKEFESYSGSTGKPLHGFKEGNALAFAFRTIPLDCREDWSGEA